jgi:hypothetical protein
VLAVGGRRRDRARSWRHGVSPPIGATTLSGSSRPGGWSNRDFYDEVPARRRLFARGWVSAVVTVGTFVVFFYAIAHENNACGLACYDISERPYEAGHAWTAYRESWQWQAQWALGLGSFAAGLGALATTSRYRLQSLTPALNGVAVALAAGWVVWRALEPALPSI